MMEGILANELLKNPYAASVDVLFLVLKMSADGPTSIGCPLTLFQVREECVRCEGTFGLLARLPAIGEFGRAFRLDDRGESATRGC